MKKEKTHNNLIENFKQFCMSLDLKEKDEDDITKIIKRWEDLGLLDGLESEQKPIIAFAFEHLAKEIISPVFKYGDITYLETISFPLVRRILVKNNNYIKLTNDTVKLFITKLISDLAEQIPILLPELVKIGEKYTLDYEGLLCGYFADNYQLSDNYEKIKE